MVTINTYPGVSDGEGLAEVANRVLGNYKQNNAVVVRTSSVPRTADRPAEHLIVVLFPVRDSIEAVFARLRLAVVAWGEMGLSGRPNGIRLTP